MTIAIYPGSFDPVTLGHLDILTRASHLFEKVLVSVADNSSKKASIPLAERVQLMETCSSHLPNVTVKALSGLTVAFAKSHGAKVIIRGLRAVSDFEYEFMMSQMNKTLDADIETVFLMAGLEYQFLSSSMVKEVVALGGDVSHILPEPVKCFLERYVERSVRH